MKSIATFFKRCIKIPDGIINETQPAMLIIIAGEYSSVDELPSIQERRDRILGSFKIAEYCKNINFFSQVLDHHLNGEDSKTILLMSDEEEIIMVRSGNDITGAELIAEASLFASVPTSSIKRQLH